MKNSTKIRLCLAVNHMIVFGSLFVLPVGWLIAGFIVSAVLHYLIQSRLLHHGISHKTLRLDREWKDWLACLLVWLLGIGSTISYTAAHRAHHRYADTALDPHSPLVIAPWRVWLTFWLPVKTSPSSVADLLKKPVHRFMHDCYGRVWIVLMVCAAFMSPALLYLIALMSVMAFHRAGFYNVFGHTLRSRHPLLYFIWIHDLHHEQPQRY